MLAPGARPEAADEARAQVGHDVAVEVLEQQHVEAGGVEDELHAAVVHDDVVVLDVGEVRGDLRAAVEEQAVRELHDVGLVDGGDPLPAVGPRVVEGELRDPGRGLLGDDLDRLHHARHHHVLEARVEVLGVLADDDEVDVVVPALHPGQRLDRAHVRVEVEGLAQGHVDRGVAAARPAWWWAP